MMWYIWYMVHDMIWYDLIRYYMIIIFIGVCSRFEPIEMWTKKETAQYTKTNNNGQ